MVYCSNIRPLTSIIRNWRLGYTPQASRLVSSHLGLRLSISALHLLTIVYLSYKYPSVRNIVLTSHHKHDYLCS